MTEHEDEPGGDEVDPDGPPEGPKITDPDELLWRQVHRTWIQRDVPTSQAFRPTPKDRKRLSTARSSMITASQAYQRHLEQGRQTVGSWAVTAGEADQATTPAHHDGGTAGLPEDHASLYFGGKARAAAETAAKLLRAAATTRGRQHP